MNTPSQPARHKAFISYRRIPRDSKWAKWLHRKLETYRTPRALVATGKAKRLTRVFRDEEELQPSSSLSASIQSELESSEYLIVVCSPETVESKWVNAEIEYFQSLGRGDHILPVLISGTPESSFPPALRRMKAESSENEDLPLAAQLPTKLFRYFERRLALLRLLAPLLDCRFDDLRRRDEQRKRRRIVMVSALGATILLASLVGLWRFERSRIEELTTHSQTWINQDASRSLLLSRIAFDRTRRLEAFTTWFGIARDESVRNTLESAIYNNRLRGEFRMQSQPVQAVAWYKGNHLVAGDYDGNVNVWDRFSGVIKAHHSFPNGIQRLVVQTHNGSPTIVMITGQVKKIGGATILTPEGAIKDLYVWDVTSNNVQSKRLSSDVLTQNPASLSGCESDNRVVVSTGVDRMWMIKIEGNVPKIVELPGAEKPENRLSGYVNALRWNTDCTAIAVATTLEVFTWTTSTGDVTHDAEVQSDVVNGSQIETEGVLAIDWNQNGTLAFGSQNSIVRVGRQFLSGHQRPVRAVLWNHAGDRLATAGEDGVIRIWEWFENSMKSEPVVAIYANQGEYISDLAWSLNDSELASVGADNTIRVWNVLPPETVLRPSDGRPLHLDDQGRWTSIGPRLTDVELADLARQLTFRFLTAKECEEYLRSSPCPRMQGAIN